MALVAPQLRPSGSFAQPSIVVNGFGAWFSAIEIAGNQSIVKTPRHRINVDTVIHLCLKVSTLASYLAQNYSRNMYCLICASATQIISLVVYETAPLS